MNTIPDWAGKRACELLNAENPTYSYRWPFDGLVSSVRTVAKLVMQHETAPADPDEEAVKRILAAYYGDDRNHGTYLSQEHLARAVAQYKKEKAK